MEGGCRWDGIENAVVIEADLQPLDLTPTCSDYGASSGGVWKEKPEVVSLCYLESGARVFMRSLTGTGTHGGRFE